MKHPTLPKAYNKYGAQMGRPNTVCNQSSKEKFRLYKMKLVGDYDQGGAYWGGGSVPMWHAFNAAGNDMFVRAGDREAAKGRVLETFPTARFFK